jgi:hypothetical protein
MSGSEFKLNLPRVHPARDVFAVLANRPTAQFSRIWADMIIYSYQQSCWRESAAPTVLASSSMIPSPSGLGYVWPPALRALMNLQACTSYGSQLNRHRTRLTHEAKREKKLFWTSLTLRRTCGTEFGNCGFSGAAATSIKISS